jgi:hypothetical protein
MAHPTRGEPANVSGAGIVFGVFAALVCQMMLNLLGLGLGLVAADPSGATADAQTGGWVAFSWWAVSGILSAFVGGWVAGWMAGAVDGSPGFHGLATWAVATVIVMVGASLIAATGTAIGSIAAPSFRGVGGAENLSRADAEAAADAAGAIALASFIALIIGAVASYVGANMAAHREVRLYPHTQRRI